MKTIQLALTNGEVACVNVDRIDAFITTGFGTNVFVGGAEKPFVSKDSYNDIFEKIAKSEHLEWEK